MSIRWKEILSLAGIVCILWSNYQLFAVELEDAMIGETVTAVTKSGNISGRAIGTNRGTVAIATYNAIEQVPQRNIIEVDNTSAFNFETRRAVVAVCISTAGGLIIWTALFFL